MSEALYPAVILAGGLATRLGPMAERRPKSLVDVNGQPFIAHQLRLLARHGVRNVVLCAGHLGEQILLVVGDGREFGLSVRYSFDGRTLLGTGGAVRKALPLIDGDAFFVLYGDSYLECSYRQVQQSFQEQRPPALMTVFRNDGQWDVSNVEFADGRILAYDKKNRSARMQYIDFGLGVLGKSVFDSLPPGQPFDLAELHQDLLRAGRLAACEVPHRFYEVGSLAGLEETRQYLARRRPVPEVCPT